MSEQSFRPSGTPTFLASCNLSSRANRLCHNYIDRTIHCRGDVPFQWVSPIRHPERSAGIPRHVVPRNDRKSCHPERQRGVSMPSSWGCLPYINAHRIATQFQSEGSPPQGIPRSSLASLGTSRNDKEEVPQNDTSRCRRMSCSFSTGVVILTALTAILYERTKHYAKP